MVVPSLLWSCAGSTRASTAVLSQTEPAPGAVIDAQAVPPDCGKLPPLAVFSASSSDIVVGCEVTVMSAPTRASQNGETDCLTDTAEAPLPLLFADQFTASPLAPRAADPAGFGAGPSRKVEASTLSWLQSSLLTSISFMSGSLASAVSASAAAACGSSSTFAICAKAGSATARLKPAASASATACLHDILGIINQPASNQGNRARI